MVTSRIFRGNDKSKPSSQAMGEMSFEQAQKDLRMWIVGCSNDSLDIILKDGGLFHLEGEGEVCQWHYLNGAVTEYYNGGETVLVR